MLNDCNHALKPNLSREQSGAVVEALKRALRLELAAEVEVARTGSAWLDVVAGQRISSDNSSSSGGIGSKARAKLSRNLKRARCVYLYLYILSIINKFLYACVYQAYCRACSCCSGYAVYLCILS
jgi:hypothetical protein